MIAWVQLTTLKKVLNFVNFSMVMKEQIYFDI